MQSKKELRKKYSLVRRQLASAAVHRKSGEIARQLIEVIQRENVHSIHVFLPIADEHEPDLSLVIYYAIDNGAEVYASYPPSGRHVGTLEANYQNQLKEYRLQDDVRFDLVIVPMLAYDPKTRHRLGYGGGFYDRLLAKSQHHQSIGVCFSECVATLPVEAHDQPLDRVIIA